MFPPQYLYTCTIMTSACPKVPCSADAVQMHYIPGHYVLSAQRRGIIYMYDSLPGATHRQSILQQLQLLYEGFNEAAVQYVTPQFQGSTLLCGLFTIANAVSLLTHDNPAGLHFHTHFMRTHLLNCLTTGVFQPFPHNRLLADIPTTTTDSTQDTSSLLKSYFNDQTTKGNSSRHSNTTTMTANQLGKSSIPPDVHDVTRKRKSCTVSVSIDFLEKNLGIHKCTLFFFLKFKLFSFSQFR